MTDPAGNTSMVVGGGTMAFQPMIARAYGTVISKEQGDFDESVGLPRGFAGGLCRVTIGHS